MYPRTLLVAIALVLAAGCGDASGKDGPDGSTGPAADAQAAPGADAGEGAAADAGEGATADAGGVDPAADSGSTEPGDAGQPASGDAGGEEVPPDAAGCTPPPTLSPMAIADPPLAIVTSTALEPAFEAYARFHTLTGKPAQVVTTAEICAASTCNDADPRADTARAIKAWLASRAGLQYVVLGGRAAQVPSRRVHDSYSNPIEGSSFDEDFLTDYYYADFSEWDSNADGVYAGSGDAAPGYLPSVAVSRVPASTAAEAQAYLDKLVQHYTAYDGTKLAKVMLLSNVATSFSGIDIDGAFYFIANGKTKDLLPAGSSVDRLYATRFVEIGAEDNDVSNQIEHINEGQNLVIHNGHGGVNDLAVEYDGSNSFTATDASALSNAHYPIYLSCACEAGVIDREGAGVRLVMNPHGGAIAYLGNTTIGLGLAGSAQMVDEVLRYLQATPNPWLADALKQAHASLPRTDWFTVPYLGVPLPVVDESSWDWTQKASVLLGDAVLPVWLSARASPPAITASKAPACGATEISFAISPPREGTLRFFAEGEYYEVELAPQQAAVTVAITSDPASILVGFESAVTLYGYYDLAL